MADDPIESPPSESDEIAVKVQEEKFKPSLTDQTAYADDEVAA